MEKDIKYHIENFINDWMKLKYEPENGILKKWLESNNLNSNLEIEDKIKLLDFLKTEEYLLQKFSHIENKHIKGIKDKKLIIIVEGIEDKVIFDKLNKNNDILIWAGDGCNVVKLEETLIFLHNIVPNIDKVILLDEDHAGAKSKKIILKKEKTAPWWNSLKCIYTLGDIFYEQGTIEDVFYDDEFKSFFEWVEEFNNEVFHNKKHSLLTRELLGLENDLNSLKEKILFHIKSNFPKIEKEMNNHFDNFFLTQNKMRNFFKNNELFILLKYEIAKKVEINSLLEVKINQWFEKLAKGNYVIQQKENASEKFNIDDLINEASELLK